MSSPDRKTSEIAAPGTQVMPLDTARRIAQELGDQNRGAGNKTPHQVQDQAVAFVKESNALHRSGYLSELNIVGTSSDQLLLADNHKGKDHHVYSVDAQGKVTAVFDVLLGSDGKRILQKIERPRKELPTPQPNKSPELKPGRKAEATPAPDDRAEPDKRKPTDVPPPPIEHPESNAEKQAISELHATTGVFVKRFQDKYVYLTTANGKYETLFTTEANLEGLNQAKKQLGELVDQKVADLQGKYKVTVCRQNDTMPNAEKPGCTLVAREPRLDELNDLEAALKRSNPSHLATTDPNGPGLKFIYLKEGYLDATANYVNQSLTICIQPSKDDRPEPVLDAQGQAVNNTDLSPFSYTGALIHEMGHHAQWRWGWVHYVDRPDLVTKAGWVPCKADPEKNLLQGKDGKLYKPRIKDDNTTDGWITCNESGEPLDGSGNVVSADQATQVSNEDMSALARVTPPTSYFTNPGEMWADGIRSFRLDRYARLAFMSRSPQFYQVVKEQDQNEIDATYGSGKYIRGIDGLLVADNVSNRASVSIFENQTP